MKNLYQFREDFVFDGYSANLGVACEVAQAAELNLGTQEVIYGQRTTLPDWPSCYPAVLREISKLGVANASPR